MTSLLWSLLVGTGKSARLARQRLHAPLDHEQAPRQPDFLPALQQELTKLASRYVKVHSQDIKIRVGARHDTQVIVVRIPLPRPTGTRAAVASAAP